MQPNLKTLSQVLLILLLVPDVGNSLLQTSFTWNVFAKDFVPRLSGDISCLKTQHDVCSFNGKMLNVFAKEFVPKYGSHYVYNSQLEVEDMVDNKTGLCADIVNLVSITDINKSSPSLETTLCARSTCLADYAGSQEGSGIRSKSTCVTKCADSLEGSGIRSIATCLADYADTWEVSGNRSKAVINNNINNDVLVDMASPDCFNVLIKKELLPVNSNSSMVPNNNINNDLLVEVDSLNHYDVLSGEL